MAKPSSPPEPSAELQAELRALHLPCPELDDAAALLAGLDARLAAERSSRWAWLRSRPSWQRLLLATLVICTPMLLLVRDHASEYRRVLLIAMMPPMLASLWLGLRSHAKRALRARTLLVWLAGSLLALLAINVWATSSFGLADAQKAAIDCFWTGLLFAWPVYVLLRLLDRGDNPHGPLLALASGVSVNLALNLHCASRAVGHNLLGHFALVITMLAGHALVDAYLVRRERQ